MICLHSLALLDCMRGSTGLQTISTRLYLKAFGLDLTLHEPIAFRHAYISLVG